MVIIQQYTATDLLKLSKPNAGHLLFQSIVQGMLQALGEKEVKPQPTHIHNIIVGL